MKIILIGHFNDSLDEGVRNVAKNIYNYLKKSGVEVKKVDVKSAVQWKTFKSFKPDIIHLVLSPTLLGIFFSSFIKFYFPKAKVIISAIHPSVPEWTILRMLSPDLVLVQSEEAEIKFNSLGYKTAFLPNGVDIHKFAPVSREQKYRLRKQYSINCNTFIVLHLASLNKQRNLDVFIRVQQEKGVQSLIIGRDKEDYDKTIVKKLQEAGCLVLINHFDRIEDIYNLSDCYVFPTKDKKACIEIPLSVLEAMACNKPVITTKFGAVPRLFNKTNNGLYYYNNDTELIKIIINKLRCDNYKVYTREQVINYSWDILIELLKRIYRSLQ